MGATCAITVSATCSGLPEGGIDQISFTMSNTSAAHTAQAITCSTAQGTAGGINIPTSAQFVLVIPPATNTFPWRFTASTAEPGFPMASNGSGLLRVTGGSVAYAYTTAGTAFTVRFLTY